jgi:hypothetical protein
VWESRRVKLTDEMLRWLMVGEADRVAGSDSGKEGEGSGTSSCCGEKLVVINKVL